jgi:hypothetical protein
VQVLARQLTKRYTRRWDAHLDQIRKHLLRRLRTRTAKNVRNKLNDITEGKAGLSAKWKNKVRFRVRVYATKGDEIRVWADPVTNKDVWHWVSRGTRGPYPIEAKNAPALVFQWGFAKYSPPPKSYPRGVSLPPGGAAETVAFKRVMHPGIDARNFEERALKDLFITRDFRNDVRNAMRDWRKEWSTFK